MHAVKFVFNDKKNNGKLHRSFHGSKAAAVSFRAAMTSEGRCARGSGTITDVDVPDKKVDLLAFINGQLNDVQEKSS